MAEPLLRQLFLVLGTTLNVAAEVTVLGFTAILLPQLRSPTSGFATDRAVDSWLASVPTLGIVFGVMLVPLLLDRIGRKKCHLLTIVPTIIGWIMIIFATNTNIMIVARLIQGLATGLRIPLSSIIIAECTAPKYRGAFLATINLSIAIGLFIPHLIGTFYSWHTTAIVSASLSGLSLFVILALPDSPTWLAKVDRMDEALRAFRWFRGEDHEALSEFEGMTRNLKKQEEAPKENFFKALLTADLWEPFLLVLVVGVAYHGSGVYVMSNYMIDILSKSFNSEDTPYVIMLAVDVLRIFVALIGCFIMKKFNRRTVFHMSCFITILSLIILSVYIYMQRHYDFYYSAIVVIALFMYIYGVGTGLQGMTYVLLGEVFPIKFKSIGAMFATVITATIGFLLLLSAPLSFHELGRDGSFAIYAAIVAICWCYVYFKMPETKDKTLEEIERKKQSH